MCLCSDGHPHNDAYYVNIENLDFRCQYWAARRWSEQGLEY